MLLQRARPRAWLGKPISICRTNSAVKALIGRVILSSLTTITPDPVALGRRYSAFPKPTGPFVGNRSSAGGQVPEHTRFDTFVRQQAEKLTNALVTLMVMDYKYD